MFAPGGWNPLEPFDLKAERIPAEEWTSTCVVRRVRGVARQSYALEDVENKETHSLNISSGGWNTVDLNCGDKI